MYTKEGRQALSSSLKASKNRFLNELAEESGFSVNKIKQTLAKEGITTYDPEKKATYRATVLAYSDRYNSIGEHLSYTPKPEPCLMPGCKGQRVTKHNAWVCTEGGRRHYWAVFIAETTGHDAKDVLVTLTDMKEQATERDEAARKLWLEEMSKREENTETPQ
jgi:hypothetical protein